MKLTELIRDDSSISTMRWSLVQVTRMSYILITCSGFHIIYNTLKDREISWTGIAILLAAITAFLGAAVTGKWLQKREEKK